MAEPVPRVPEEVHDLSKQGLSETLSDIGPAPLKHLQGKSDLLLRYREVWQGKLMDQQDGVGHLKDRTHSGRHCMDQLRRQIRQAGLLFDCEGEIPDRNMFESGFPNMLWDCPTLPQ